MASQSVLTPGGPVASRPLHFFFVCDCSGSMNQDGKIDALNNAIRDTIPFMLGTANQNPNAQVYVRVLNFSNGAHWHTGNPTPIEQFIWSQDLTAEGVTDMGKALNMLADELEVEKMGQRALPPVIVLISDGQPTDEYQSAIDRLLKLPWGKKAVKLAIAIGKDADTEVLGKFVANSEIPVLEAQNANALLNYIKWASTAVLKAASSPASQPKDAQASANVPIPTPPQNVIGNPNDVW